MVLKEPMEDGTDYTPMSSTLSTVAMEAIKDEDVSDSNSSSESQSSFVGRGHKRGAKRRKAEDEDPDEDREEKRKKNREAAKRCRDKKQQQTENLKHKNGELEKENCSLAKQRDELIRKCQEYQQEIEQHKHRGCVVPHFSPPYDLDQILHPTSPPASPSFSESAHSTSSCPSPAPSISPGPPPKQGQRPSRVDVPQSQSMAVHEAPLAQVTDSRMGTVARVTIPSQAVFNASGIPSMMTTVPPAQSEPLQLPNQKLGSVHYLRVRNKDGTHKNLCLDHETYLKVIQKIRTQIPGRLQRKQGQTMKPSASTLAPVSQSQQTMAPQGQLGPQLCANSGAVAMQPQLIQQVDVQENGPKPGQKLDTFDDLISVLEGNIKATEHGFELRQVSPSNVQIKEEPVDSDYEPQSSAQTNLAPGMMQVKHEEVNVQGGSASKTSGTYSQWSSTAHHIRAGLDAITNPDEPSSTSAQIQNIVQYLERDDSALAVPASHQSTTQVVVQTPARSSNMQQGRPQVRTAAATVSRPEAGQGITFVTSSASVGSLSKLNAGCDQVRQAAPSQPMARIQHEGNSVAGQQRIITTSMGMQNVQQRPSATQQSGSASAVPGEKLQMPGQQAAAIHVQPPKVAPALAQAANTLWQQNRVMLQNNVAAETRIQQTSNTMWTSSSSQIPQSQASFPSVAARTATSQLQKLPPQSVTPQQRPPPSTIDASALAPIQVQMGQSDNLMSESTSQIMDYLNANSIESMG